jgi:4-oxalocrotonate tautomerase
MPHIIVKLYPGRTEEQKIRLTEAITKDVVEIAKCPEEAVSLAIEEISQDEWDEKVNKPDILNKRNLSNGTVCVSRHLSCVQVICCGNSYNSFLLTNLHSCDWVHNAGFCKAKAKRSR